MAVTKTITARGSKGHHTYSLTVTETATSVADNTSTLSFSFSLIDDNNWYWESQGTRVAYTITIGSHIYSGYIPHHTTNTTEVRSESGITETHNNDGTKTITIAFDVTDSTSISYLSGSASASSTLTLTTIPRASAVTLSNQTIANTSGSVNFTVTSASDFYHTYKYTINGWTDGQWRSLGEINTTSQQFSVIAKTTILDHMPAINTATLTVDVRTYGDSALTNLIGTQSASGTITVTLAPTAPTLTTLAFRSRSAGVNTSITTATAGYTTVALTSWTAGTSYGSSSRTTYFSVDQGASLQTASATADNTVIETNTLPASAKQYTLTYTAYTVDSRGNQSATATKTIAVYGYTTPTLSLTAYRVSSSTATTEDASGTYAYVTFGNTLRGQTDADGALRSGNQNAVVSATCKYGSTAVTSGQHIALAVENTITFTYTVQDRFTTTSTTRTVSNAIFPLDLYDDGSGNVGVGLGAIAQSGKITAGLPIEVSGSVTANSFNGNATSATSATSATTATNANNIHTTALSRTSYAEYYPTLVGGASTANQQPYVFDGMRLGLKNGTTSADGNATLMLGNSTASGTAGNKQGILSLFSTNSYRVNLYSAELNGNKTQYLPNANGTLALHDVQLWAGSLTGTNSIDLDISAYKRIRIYAQYATTQQTLWEIDVTKLHATTQYRCNHCEMSWLDTAWFHTIFELSASKARITLNNVYNMSINGTTYAQNNSTAYQIYQIDGIL